MRNVFVLTPDGYLCADGQPSGTKDYEEHQYVNTQSLENLESLTQSAGHKGAKAHDSPKKDLFDMSEYSKYSGTYLSLTGKTTAE